MTFERLLLLLNNERLLPLLTFARFLLLLRSGSVMSVQVSSQVHGTVHRGAHQFLLLLLNETLLFSLELLLESFFTEAVVTFDGVLPQFRLVVLVRDETIEGREGNLMVTLGLVVQFLEGGVQMIE